ncbi:MAG: efflux RND transporter permease subunit, partial [Pseudomonadales bacterium]|nr:efflux RND transporter permease subunit [Pseudomonadales bacterium]
MLTWLIQASIRNRILVLMLAALLAAAGIEAVRTVPVDALPDLSDTQVIVRAQFAGQPPGVVQDQVSYPLATAMLSVPMAKTVRSYSLYGDAYLYIIFDEGTNLYWARSRVLESLSQVQGRLPPGVNLSLGPDATGVGWIYEYALVDHTGQHDISQLRSLQDWFLRYQLKTVPNVAEVASLGGMVKQYQVVVDPVKLASLQLTTQEVVDALKRANQEVGGSVIEMAQTDFMVRAHGYLSSLDDFRDVPLRTGPNGTVVRIGDVARVSIGPQMRLGVAELDGRGEVAGGVVLLRSGKNAMTTLEGVKARLAQLQKSLPPGVEIVPTYDRSALIQRAVDNLQRKLIEEFIVVALVTLLFLGHLRSSLVAIISLPLGLLMAFIVMNYLGINANIMSLGGIAIAVGAMIDAAVVMIENAHRHLEHWQQHNPGQILTGEPRWQLIAEAASEVGPALFFSLLIITFSFIPVFTLQGQEGKLFAPLAYTKTLVMAAAALLAVTVVPVLMGYWIRGDIASESSNPLNRWLIRAYQPLLQGVLRHPMLTIAGALLIAVSSWWPWTHIGGEFLPPLDEGTLLYMPSALPGMSAEQASHLLQITDRMIKSIPEVDHVFGKAGR